MAIKGRSIVTLKDFTNKEVADMIDLGLKLKKDKKAGKNQRIYNNKNIVLQFQKDSTRTRSAFEVAAMDLGMGVTFVGPSGSHMGKKESVEDTAKVLGRMYDVIGFRGYKNADTLNLAEHAGVPVINGLDELWHPTQMIADFMTIKENFKSFKGLKLSFMGDPKNNMGRSLALTSAKLGMHFYGVGPKNAWPDKEFISEMEEIAKETGGSVNYTDDAKEGTIDANILYTDVWVSMGDPESAWKERTKSMKPYQVNKEMVDNAASNVIFLHCLPAFHDMLTETSAAAAKKYPTIKTGEMEVTDEVFRSPISKVFDEAENRMHSIKAMLVSVLGK